MSSPQASPLRATVDEMFAPWTQILGAANDGYKNHACRVFALCGLLGERQESEIDSDTRLAWQVAAVFHDLGIWSDDTWDYIDPSVHLANTWLAEHKREDLIPVVERMIREHHGVRPRGPADDPVEIFRRADLIDMWLGARNFGVGRGRYRELLRRHPDRGFHRVLLGKFAGNLVRKPWRPLPMYRL